MIDFAKLAEESHTTSVEKGWYEQDDQGKIKQRFTDEVCSLFHSEISEAVEELRQPFVDQHPTGIYTIDSKGNDRYPAGRLDDNPDLWPEIMATPTPAGTTYFKPEGVAVELADLLIRLGDSCVAWDCVPGIQSCLDNIQKSEAKMLNQTPVGAMINLHIAVDELYKRINLREAVSKPVNDSLVCLAAAVVVSDTEYLCRCYGWDLERAIKLKLAYNRSRPWRHGGKKA